MPPLSAAHPQTAPTALQHLIQNSNPEIRGTAGVDEGAWALVCAAVDLVDCHSVY